MLPLLLNKIIQTDKLLFLHLVTQKNRIYTFLNPVSYLIALENKSLFEQFDGIFADGVTRRSFDMTSLAPELLNYLMESRKTLYIVASGQEQVECSVRIFQEQYPELRIAGFRNGYFSSDAEMNKEASHIVELNPDFLIVGMGALMQEKFLLKVKKMGYQGIGFTCGGFVHQTAMNRMHYYPNWVDKMNLRFVYRMYKEKHTRTRYLQAAFLFPVRFIGERIFG
ncbi:MAG: glycosyltransferase [Bacteroides sp. 43_108]|nr:MAG: glycosyltransferase [Bacteroides sp. 43_108]